MSVSISYKLAYNHVLQKQTNKKCKVIGCLLKMKKLAIRSEKVKDMLPNLKSAVYLRMF